MDDKEFKQNVIDALHAVPAGFEGIRKTMKQQNDENILHHHVTLEIRKYLKDLFVWVVKVLVIALILLAGAKEVLDLI